MKIIEWVENLMKQSLLSKGGVGAEDSDDVLDWGAYSDESVEDLPVTISTLGDLVRSVWCWTF
jgi:hypothetical protein